MSKAWDEAQEEMEQSGGIFVKLADGSEHRSSRTYADRLDAWLNATKS